MFGGGEEYFQEPPAIDRETLQAFAAFCAALRELRRPTKTAIEAAASLGRAVGAHPQAFELVVGALFRHVKVWTGPHQLACWYVLDSLAKAGRDHYGHVAGRYLLEVGRDHIPYEDPTLAAKYDSLVAHWERVFPRHVVDAIWLGKKERLWAVAHPDEVAEQQRAEEETWAREERAMADEDGLNLFGQPCMDYLQGRCIWGAECRLYHPPGEEGSLPMECRMGDWKCPSCGVINRHFRRRCANCVREKPQYKKERTQTAEDALLTAPDNAALQSLRQQFGYNPYLEEEAIQHWRLRFENTDLKEYLDERRAAYKVRILHRKPNNALEERCKTQKHFPDVDIGPDEAYLRFIASGGTLTNERSAKQRRYEGLIPPGTAPSSAVSILSQMILERGVRDSTAATLFAEFGRYVRALASEEGEAQRGNAVLSPTQVEALLSAAKLGFTAWNTNKESVPFVAAFFKTIRHVENKIGLSAEDSSTLLAMTTNFLA
ncbi:unnamed protein product [Phytomonas sp. Hart1]|nr:unnamed protein product [Phytomonas sp. Hart1]|eukprot:CCW66454.1 unnamed protein product [Phytomonas sp. isolate Hart1]